jgi:hypothetical protein
MLDIGPGIAKGKQLRTKRDSIEKRQQHPSAKTRTGTLAHPPGDTNQGEKPPAPLVPSPHRGWRTSLAADTDQQPETTRTPCGQSPHRGAGRPQNSGQKPPERLVGKAHTGGSGGSSPQKIHTWGGGPKGHRPWLGGAPRRGGRARGTARSRPWGGGPDPFLKKLIPNMAQHEAAQGNYNINELIVNRCCGGLFAPGAYLPPTSGGHPRSTVRLGSWRARPEPLRARWQGVSAVLVANCM